MWRFYLGTAAAVTGYLVFAALIAWAGVRIIGAVEAWMLDRRYRKRIDRQRDEIRRRRNAAIAAWEHRN